MIKIKTPATTANMGAGFDSFGMAFKLYNEIEVKEAEEFCIVSNANVPKTKDNLIYKSILHFYNEVGKTMPILNITQIDRIPFTRGLGSSSACVVSGLVCANTLTGNILTTDDILQMACKIEGHPDNVAPALLGGIVVAALENNKVSYVKIDPPTKLSFISIVPDFSLYTKKSRGVLPQSYSMEDVVHNISRSGLFIASILTNKWENIATALDDKIHQPYRKPLIPNIDDIFNKSKELGTLGTYLSGAGPTIMAISLKEHTNEILANLTDYLQTLETKWTANILEANNNGVEVIA